MLSGLLRRFGVQLIPLDSRVDLYRGESASLYERLKPYTMASRERVLAAYSAARYVAETGLDGDVVECGVWRGGCSIAMLLGLTDGGDRERRLWLYDTFEGMTPPTDVDRKVTGLDATTEFGRRARVGEAGSDWCFASEEDVRRNLQHFDVPASRVQLVRGPVERTIPATVPDRIALLRLDTDWYESTRHELEHLYPRLVPGGLLLLDDYGEWEGARRAVDEYFANVPRRPFLARIDLGGRVAVKPGV